jgi:ABC-type nickel/cobalt efflux system permease component RcnA
MPVTGTRTTRLLAALALGLMLVVALDSAAALAAGAGPFGVAAPEAGGGAAPGGLFGWIAAEQSRFYRALTGAVRALRTDPFAVASLVGLSFAYGVMHAAGPGHGKAVIASYVVANGETVRRGIALSFVSAFLQASVAIVFVGIATWLLNLTSLAMTEATRALELVSAVLVTSLGLWLVWTKVLRRGRRLRTAGAPVAAAPATAGLAFSPAHVHGADCRHEPALRGRTATAPTDAFVCADCGHGHAPDPRDLAGPMTLGRAVSAVFAVGIRPCTGALIVLVFAFAQGLYWAGVLAALAMALGTGITVAVLASLAVSAKSAAVSMAGLDTPWSGRIMRGAEVLGAVAILSMGVILLGASLVGHAVAY